MSRQWSIIGNQGFEFMGEINASISHEIKNVLAIINENAGLLEDFTFMVDRGMPIDPERLKSLAGKIQHQIKRADGIVKNMNRFAHSVDESCKNVELGEILDFVAALSARLIINRGVTLDIDSNAEPVVVMTNPFLLENLIWLCIDFAMDMTGDGKTIGVSCKKTPRGAEIKLSELDGFGSMTAPDFPKEREKAFLEALDGEMTICRETGEILLVLPETIKAGS